MTLVDPRDGPERQIAKLTRIAEALMRRVEQRPDHSGLAYAQFERAVLLEEEVRQRTADLERTLDLLHASNARLATAMREGEAARSNLAEAIETVEGGFALFDAGDRLVMHNSRFCQELDDVAAALEPGLPFARYVALVAGSRHLALPEGDAPADWRRLRMRRHADSRTTFNVRLALDRWIQVSEHRTGSGGTVILQTDVTHVVRRERRERDRLIDRQARTVRATLDHLAQGVGIFDAGARLAGWNAQLAALVDEPLARDPVGCSLAELLDLLGGRFRFTGAVDRTALLAWAAQATPRGALAFEAERAGGQAFAVHARELPDRGFVISFTDVTPERAAREALREAAEELERRVESRTEALHHALEEARLANASKTRFMAAASHDLLQPLSAAKLFAASLEDRAADAETAEIAGKAVSALQSVETIIDALLDISKLDAGRVHIDVGRAPLGAILEGLRSEMTPLAAARGIALRVVPCSLAVESDPVLLRRVVQNLVANAIRHTDRDRVLLGVRRDGGRARIEVWDRGPGIAPEAREVIFEEFRQLGPHRSGAGGLGLGLAIVQRACAMLDHTLHLRSEPGRGSCFSVAARALPAAAATPAPRAPGVPAVPEGLVVLLVENDPDMAEALAVMIEGWGADAIPSESGEAALALLEELDIVPDLFLVDVGLGEGMDGLALLRALRARYGAVPAAAISADRAPDLAARCRAEGAAFLLKPFAPEALAAVLTEAAARRGGA